MKILHMTYEEREYNYLTTVWGYLYYNKSKVYEVVVKQLTTEFGNKYDKEVRCIVTNAARAIKMNATGVLLTRSRDDYTGNPQGISYRKMYSLIEEMIGEYDCATLLGYFDICELPENPEQEEFIPFTELPEDVDWHINMIEGRNERKDR